MLKLNLNPIFKAKGIEKPYSFLVKSGFTYSAARGILYGNKTSFQLRHIEMLCKLFQCTPNDILFYKPDKNNELPPDHPLNALNIQLTDFNLSEVLSNLTISQINNLAQVIKDATSKKK